MQPNEEGFLYPFTDASICTDCGICRQTCPVNRERTSVDKVASEGRGSEPLAVLAAWHLDEDFRRKSSSGGVFTALAKSILAQGGMVVGAVFDDQFVVRHILIESSEELHRLRGSKYVQSEIAPVHHRQIRDLLEHGRPVLFSGTPCQIAGLRGSLRQSYENLFCCDLICMGVPSPKLFKKYIDWKCAKIDTPLVSCEFRNKVYGWKTPSMILQFSGGKVVRERSGKNPYYLAFGKQIALRPACYACDFKGVNRIGDLTLADFWGVSKKYPEYDRDDKGTSLILVNSEKGKAWLDACRPNLFLGPADLDTAVAGNPMLVSSCTRPPQRDAFYSDLDKLSFAALIRNYCLCPPSFFCRILSGIKRRIVAVWPSAWDPLGHGKSNRV